VTEENEKLPPLPQGWIWTKLEELADVVDVDHKMPKSVRDGVHFISPKDFVDPEGIDFENSKRISEEDFQRLSRKCKPESGDLIYSRIGTIGKVRKVPRDTLFHVSYSLCLIKPADTLKESDILYVFLKSPSVLKQALAKKRSIGVPDLGLGDIKKFMVPLAPLNEQKRIVGMVRELFSRLDAGVEGLRKVKAQLKRYRQAVLKYAFEGKLTEKWRKTHKHETEPATKLLEKIEQEREKDPKRKEPILIDKSELPEIQESWIWTTIGSLFDVCSGGTPSRRKPEYWNGNIPWVSSGEVAFCEIKSTNEHITKEGLENSSAKLYPTGTVLMALYGEGKTRGQAAILRMTAATNQAVACILCASSPMPPEYVYWWLYCRYYETRLVGEGANQPNMYLHHVRKMIIPVAPLLEQKEIILKVEELLTVADEIAGTVETSLLQAERLRQSILRTAFEGKLVPQDPSDEPAEKLLERIKAERAKSMGEKDTNSKNKSQLELFTYVK
jgi:type I restriction enzyme S subunit